MTINTFKDSFWGPQGFDTIEKRINQGRESNKMFVYFLKERADIEENYAKSLTKLLKHTSHVVEYGTLRDTWLAMRGEIEILIRVHQELCNKIDKEIYQPFKKFKTSTKITRRNFVHESYKINRERRDMESSINKSRSRYEEYTKEADKIANQLESAKSSKNANEIGRMQSRLQKVTKEASSHETDYRDAVNKWSSYQSSWEEKTQASYVQIQGTEEERIDTMKIHMDKYVQALSSCVIDSSSANDNLASLVNKIDKFEDINMFVLECKTGNEPPAAPSFHVAGTGTKYEYTESTYLSPTPPKPKTLTASSSSSSLVSSGSNGNGYNNNSSNSYSNGNGYNSSSSNMNEFSSSNTNGGSGGGTVNLSKSYGPPKVAKRTFINTKKMKALYDYVGSDATELDFYTGDIITVIAEDESGWWQGEIDGRKGLFPSNYTELI